MATDEFEVTLEIVCTELPGVGSNHLQLGLQRGEQIFEIASAGSKRIVFKPTLRVRRNADGSANFLGAYAQGPKAERFIYLNWLVTTGEGMVSQLGRIKLHLKHLSWSAVKKAADSARPIRVTLTLTNAKGKPVMASVHADAAKWELPS
jgi:Family of unknown function (DUF5990)